MKINSAIPVYVLVPRKPAGKALEKPKTVKMNGLRVYTDTEGLGGREVFYSRRADGPYYRWHYDEVLGHWHSSRLSLSELAHRALSVASWKAVPTALKASLSEHYLE